MELFEKQRTIEAIKTVAKARVFFILLVGLQVLLFKMIAKGLSLTDGFTTLLLVITGISFSLSYWFYVRRPPARISECGLQFVKVLVIVVDMLLVSAMLFLNGTVNTTSAGFFLVVIMSGSILFRKKGVFFATLATALLYVGLATLEYFGFFVYQPNPALLDLTSVKGSLFFYLRQAIAFPIFIVATGIYAGYLAGLNRRREKSLEIQRDELDQKAKILIQQTTELTRTKNWLNEALVKSDKLRIQADGARRDQENEKNKVAAIIQNLNDGLIMVNLEGEMILINKNAEKTLDVKKEKMVGRRLQESNNSNLVKIAYLLGIKDEEFKKRELVIDREPKEIFEISTADVGDIKGKLLGRLIVLHDVTREKAIEQMKSEFVSIAAHQLRTPVSAVKWALNLILAGDLGKITEKQKDILQKGYQSNERMIVLINDLLDVARIEEGRFVFDKVRISFADLIQRVLSSLKPKAAEKKINLVFEKDDQENFEIFVDKEKIELAVHNLIENAISYSPNKAAVVVAIKKAEGNLIFSVKDEGWGISKSQQLRLYSKFFRGDEAVKANTEGTGLGLFIVKNVIDGHGGKVWFETKEGQGSTFYFSLPFSN